MNHNKYSEMILSELSSKYNKEFEILRLNYEVSGGDGNFYRAVCREKGQNSTFVAYCLLNGSDYLLSEEMDGSLPENKNTPVLTDEYCSLLLNERFADYLVSCDLSVSHAVTNITTVSHVLTMDDLSRGVEYCLGKGNRVFEVKAYACLFVACDPSDRDNTENEIWNKLQSLDLYRLNLDIAYVDEIFTDSVKADYSDDIYMIEEKLKADERVLCYKRYSVTRDEGITLKKVVKGE